VLHSATSLAQAVQALVYTPVRTSSAITVVTAVGACTVELSPAGNRALPGDAATAYLLHTNHFLDAGLARRERTELYHPDSQQRLDLLTDRCERRFAPDSPEDLLPYLCSGPGDPAELCCVPAPGARLGDRWATLATVTLDPAGGRMQVAAGPPSTAGAGDWRTLGVLGG
jgi:isopenicillin-N N-acyltransferase-like protein